MKFDAIDMLCSEEEQEKTTMNSIKMKRRFIRSVSGMAHGYRSNIIVTKDDRYLHTVPDNFCYYLPGGVSSFAVTPKNTIRKADQMFRRKNKCMTNNTEVQSKRYGMFMMNFRQMRLIKAIKKGI